MLSSAFVNVNNRSFHPLCHAQTTPPIDPLGEIRHLVGDPVNVIQKSTAKKNFFLTHWVGKGSGTPFHERVWSIGKSRCHRRWMVTRRILEARRVTGVTEKTSAWRSGGSPHFTWRTRGLRSSPHSWGSDFIWRATWSWSPAHSRGSHSSRWRRSPHYGSVFSWKPPSSRGSIFTRRARMWHRPWGSGFTWRSCWSGGRFPHSPWGPVFTWGASRLGSPHHSRGSDFTQRRRWSRGSDITQGANGPEGSSHHSQFTWGAIRSDSSRGSDGTRGSRNPVHP